MTDSAITLRDYFEAILAEKDKALAAALVAVKEESRKTEVSAEKRFDLLNELRQGVATREQLEAVEKIVDLLSSRLDKMDGHSGGLNAGWGYVIGAVGLVGAILVIVSKL